MGTTLINWSAPVTYGSSKFEIMTDEHHARPVAVVNTLDDALLIAAAPKLLAALKHLRYNAYKSGSDMGLAIDFADEAILEATSTA